MAACYLELELANALFASSNALLSNVSVLGVVSVHHPTLLFSTSEGGRDSLDGFSKRDLGVT